MTPHYKNLLRNMPVRHMIKKLAPEWQELLEQLQMMQYLDIKHFFILAKAERIQQTLNAANSLMLYGEQYAWFAGTKV